MRDNYETSPDLIATRGRARRNQSTLSIELGLVERQSPPSTSSSSTSSSPTGAGSIVGGLSGGTVPGRGACFTGETLVGLSEPRPIISLQPGDYTDAFNFDYNDIGKCLILQKFTHTVTELLRVELPDTALYVTREHPFWDGKEFTAIGRFKAGDSVFGEAGEITIVSIVPIVFSTPITVYNIETTFRNYYANGFLAHNLKSPEDL